MIPHRRSRVQKSNRNDRHSPQVRDRCILPYSRVFELLINLLSKIRLSKRNRVVRTGLKIFKSQFEAGDAFALIESFIFCYRAGCSVPVWIVENLETKFEQYYRSGGRESLDCILLLSGGRGRANVWKARQRAERNEISMFQIFCLTKCGYSVPAACEATANRFFHELSSNPKLKAQFATLLPRKTASEYADTLRTIFYKGGWNNFWKSASVLPGVRKRIDGLISANKNPILRDAQLPAS